MGEEELKPSSSSGGYKAEQDLQLEMLKEQARAETRQNVASIAKNKAML
jgi:hypothetical protein